MRVVYIAEDGTKFDNKIECKTYEQKCNMKNCGIVMLDTNGENLEVNDGNYERCIYIKITNDKDLEIIKQMSYNVGSYSDPEEFGEFYWDDSGEWCLIDDRIEELENELKSLKEAKEKLNG